MKFLFLITVFNLTHSLFAFTLETKVVTHSLRRYDSAEGKMHAGWGPHQKGILRASDDSLWFVVDEGRSVHSNEKANFLKYDGISWQQKGALSHTQSIQQNVTTHIKGDVIYTYGVNIVRHEIEECGFNTKTEREILCHSVKVRGKAVQAGILANYIGSALTPDHEQIVWWTQVGDAGKPGALAYIFTRGGRWFGPYSVSIGGSNAFSYQFVSFLDPTHMVMAGESYFGNFPKTGYFSAQIGTLGIGGKLSPLESFSSPTENKETIGTMQELWRDPRNGNQHVFAYSFEKGRIAYYFLPQGKTIKMSEPTAYLEQSYRIRAIAKGNAVYFAKSGLGKKDAVLSVMKINFSDFTESLPFEKAEIQNAAMPEEGMLSPSGVWVESENYQTTPVGGVHFIFNGNYPLNDATAYHVKVSESF